MDLKQTALHQRQLGSFLKRGSVCQRVFFCCIPLSLPPPPPRNTNRPSKVHDSSISGGGGGVWICHHSLHCTVLYSSPTFFYRPPFTDVAKQPCLLLHRCPPLRSSWAGGAEGHKKYLLLLYHQTKKRGRKIPLSTRHPS